MSLYREMLHRAEHNIQIVLNSLSQQIASPVPDPRVLWGINAVLVQENENIKNVSNFIMNTIFNKVITNATEFSPDVLPTIFNINEIVEGLRRDAEDRDLDETFKRLKQVQQEEIDKKLDEYGEYNKEDTDA